MQPNMKMIQQMQNRLMKIQEELGTETVEATAGGGMVTVVMNGHQEVQSIKIQPEVVDPQDVEALEDLLLAAVKEAIKKSQDLAQRRMAEVTGGMKIPGLT
jgi:nucleoid-associated protein EbfC